MFAYNSYKKGFLMGADGQYHEVSEEIWTEYMRSVWREESAIKRERKIIRVKKNGSSPDGDWDCFPRVVSYDSITAHGEELLPRHSSTEDDVLGKCVCDDICGLIHRAMQELEPDEVFLLGKLYLEGDGMSIREFSSKFNRPRTTVQYQRSRLMKKLRAIIENDAGFSPEMLET